MTQSPLARPIPFTPAVETVSPDEAETNRALAEVFETIITKTHADLGHAQRGVHAKSHALLRAELTVRPDLPTELRQGIFAEPGRTYPALVRISTTPGDPLRDSVSLPRGIAIKVIGVEGDRLPGSERDVTQDFLMATAPVFSAPDAKGFLQVLKLLAATTDRAEWAKAALSATLRPLEKGLEALGTESALLKGLGGYPRTHPLGERYFTQAASRFGACMAKLDLQAASDNFRALVGQEIDYAGRENALREEVADLLARQGGAWTLGAQLCRDLEANPIEDASRPWAEEANPYLALATLVVPAQDSWTAPRSQAMDDEMSFNPWHGIEAHRPLGNIMRARRHVYPVSAGLRSHLNGCPIHEPRSVPALG
ncbi:MAG: catalase family protein [Azospirillaceae bacterium]|nr:catalase family protein [Azospirillaceae bacterium]